MKTKAYDKQENPSRVISYNIIQEDNTRTRTTFPALTRSISHDGKGYRHCRVTMSWYHFEMSQKSCWFSQQGYRNKVGLWFVCRTYVGLQCETLGLSKVLLYYNKPFWLWSLNCPWSAVLNLIKGPSPRSPSKPSPPHMVRSWSTWRLSAVQQYERTRAQTHNRHWGAIELTYLVQQPLDTAWAA